MFTGRTEVRGRKYVMFRLDRPGEYDASAEKAIAAESGCLIPVKVRQADSSVIADVTDFKPAVGCADWDKESGEAAIAAAAGYAGQGLCVIWREDCAFIDEQGALRLIVLPFTAPSEGSEDALRKALGLAGEEEEDLFDLIFAQISMDGGKQEEKKAEEVPATVVSAPVVVPVPKSEPVKEPETPVRGEPVKEPETPVRSEPMKQPEEPPKPPIQVIRKKKPGESYVIPAQRTAAAAAGTIRLDEIDQFDVDPQPVPVKQPEVKKTPVAVNKTVRLGDYDDFVLDEAAKEAAPEVQKTPVRKPEKAAPQGTVRIGEYDEMFIGQEEPAKPAPAKAEQKPADDMDAFLAEMTSDLDEKKAGKAPKEKKEKKGFSLKGIFGGKKKEKEIDPVDDEEMEDLDALISGVAGKSKPAAPAAPTAPAAPPVSHPSSMTRKSTDKSAGSDFIDEDIGVAYRPGDAQFSAQGGEKVLYLSKSKALTSGAHRIPRSGSVTIGRGQSNDIVLNKRTVSERHASIRFDQGTYYITDMASTNGTWVNGKRMMAYTSVELKPMSEIVFDDIHFFAIYEDE